MHHVLRVLPAADRQKNQQQTASLFLVNFGKVNSETQLL